MESSPSNEIPNRSLPERLAGFPITKEIINNVDVQFVGVKHHPDFFQQNRDELADIIHNSSLLIPEGLEEDATANGTDVIEKYMEFFVGVADLAKEKPGRITLVDPNTNALEILESGIIAANLAPIVYKAFKNFRDHDVISNTERTGEHEQNKPLQTMSRRILLQTALLAATSYTLVGQRMPGDILRGVLRSDSSKEQIDSTYGMDDALALNSQDYRNICIAEAIGKITRERKDELSGPITLIMGEHHPQIISSYLKEHSSLLQAKKALYRNSPFALAGNDTVRDYLYEGDHWERINREER